MKENNGLSPSRPTTAEEVRKRCPISLPWLAIYIALWQLVLFQMPDGISSGELAQEFVRSVTAIAPSIKAYSANSPDPARIAVFMSLQWCLCPIYVLLVFRCWGRKLGDLPDGPKPSRGIAVLLIAVFLLSGFALLALPAAISVDPNAVRPSRVWFSWMHESLLANGIIAVTLPIAEALMLLAAWSLFLVFPPSKN